MPQQSLISFVEIWLVMLALGSGQLLFQMNIDGRNRYPEGTVKTLQQMTGIPALAALALYLVDPDVVDFWFVSVPDSLTYAGLALFDLAALVIIWSHVTLGKFWSGDLETCDDHQLIDKGPYALVRHPLYSAYIVLTVGFFLITGNWFVSGLMMAYFVMVLARAEREEEMLKLKLGPDYAAYCDRTPRFVPAFSRR